MSANKNGLSSSTAVALTGADNSNLFVRRNQNGDVVIEGDLAISGDFAVGGSSQFVGDISANAELRMLTDLSNNIGLVHYKVGAVDYPLYPSFVKIIEPATITKQTTQTKVTALAYTIPQDGYYLLTAQISLATIGSSTPASDTITIYGDLSGGSVTPLNGAINTFNVVPNALSAYYATSSGVIQQKLTAGQIIEFYHLESGAFTIGATSSIGVTYTYLGNKAT